MKSSDKKKAIAIRYDTHKDSAPRVTAKGEGLVAKKIIELAEAYNIPIKDDPDLIEVMSSLEINEEIPPDIYVAIAELLAFVYSINSNRKL